MFIINDEHNQILLNFQIPVHGREPTGDLVKQLEKPGKEKEDHRLSR